jgi:uncharacterized protein (TIGR00251 family)
MNAATWWSARDGAITVAVRVTPGARRSEVIDASGDRLRIRVAAPALDGRANAEVQRFVAARFGVRRSAVSLLRGERSRDKTLRIAGIDAPPTDFGA